MKASRLALPAGQSLRWNGSSIVGSSARGSKSSTASSKKKSCEPSTSKLRIRCPPVSCIKGLAAEDSAVHGATSAEFYPFASNYEQMANFLNLPDCQWPNWPDWGSETHSERAGATGPSGEPYFSDTSSSSSYSDSESDLRWSASTSTSGSTSGNIAHERREMPKTCSFWDQFMWDARRPWNKLRHKKSFLTHLWDFKPETKVEDSSEPILVNVNVLGSPGPLRLVVDKNDSVQHTVDFALRRYAAQKRQPALVDPSSCFGLYCRNPDFEALEDEAKIGHRKNRQFHIYKKQRNDLTVEDMAMNDASTCESGGATSLAPIRTWVWNNLNGMRSWAGNLVAGIWRSVTFSAKYPQRVYRFIYILSVKAMSLGVC